MNAFDYFETDKSVDAKRVGLEGHSRWGKATIVAMAYDQRFWTAYVSSSGEGGAKLNRPDWGEIVENVAGPVYKLLMNTDKSGRTYFLISVHLRP
jgi:hypothetical protein